MHLLCSLEAKRYSTHVDVFPAIKWIDAQTICAIHHLLTLQVEPKHYNSKKKESFSFFFSHFQGCGFLWLYKINLIICCQTERKKKISRAERRKMCFRDYKMKGIKLLWVHRVFPFFPSAKCRAVPEGFTYKDSPWRGTLQLFVPGCATEAWDKQRDTHHLKAWLWARPRAQECATEKGPGEHW